MDIQQPDTLSSKLSSCFSIHEKIAFLDQHPTVIRCLKASQELKTLLKEITPECELALKQVMAIDQWEKIVGGAFFGIKELRSLLEKLVSIDQFYREMGGIVGYHEEVAGQLQKKKQKEESALKKGTLFHAPSFVNLADKTQFVEEIILEGLKALPFMAEIYPLGGAADRLHLQDQTTKEELPAAKLGFLGRTLFEGLIRDLQAREYLYYKSFKKEVITPIAIMTSYEKNNHFYIQEILKENNWFGRPKELFSIFAQPQVPTLDEQGNWHILEPMKPFFKPNGHGAIWKMAKDAGVFSWLKSLDRKKALVRQINNPIAGLDYGLLAFTGFGVLKNQIFGFASCPRLVHAAEGVNVLIEKEGKEIVLTNIEYCDFKKYGIEDRPLSKEEPYSRFSSNTNILFIDIEAVEKAVEKNPYPGLLVNQKKGTIKREEKLFARLESTMQNIADIFVEEKKETLNTTHTFVTYNHRHKTISTTKKAFVNEKSIQETPENCLYDLLKAHRELLEKECGFELPPLKDVISYLKEGPEFFFCYHPALGPVYSLLREKLKGGKLFPKASLELEIASLKIENLSLDGALKIEAENVVGKVHSQGILSYSDQVGHCVLKNVKIKNLGVDWKNSKPFWKNEKKTFEQVEIILKGHSEFIAEDLNLEGAHRFVVEDGYQMRVSPENFKMRKIG